MWSSDVLEMFISFIASEIRGLSFARFSLALTFKFVINFDASFKVPTELTATGGRYAFRWFYRNWASKSAAE